MWSIFILSFGFLLFALLRYGLYPVPALNISLLSLGISLLLVGIVLNTDIAGYGILIILVSAAMEYAWKYKFSYIASRR